MSAEVLEHPFWWRVFERRDAKFPMSSVKDVHAVTAVETENGSTSPDLDVTALVTLTNGHGASIRAHYSHRRRAITVVRWSTTTHPFPLADAA